MIACVCTQQQSLDPDLQHSDWAPEHLRAYVQCVGNAAAANIVSTQVVPDMVNIALASI